MQALLGNLFITGQDNISQQGACHTAPDSHLFFRCFAFKLLQQVGSVAIEIGGRKPHSLIMVAVVGGRFFGFSGHSGGSFHDHIHGTSYFCHDV